MSQSMAFVFHGEGHGVFLSMPRLGLLCHILKLSSLKLSSLDLQAFLASPKKLPLSMLSIQNLGVSVGRSAKTLRTAVVLVLKPLSSPDTTVWLVGEQK